MSVPIWEILLRLFIALVVGGAVGAQREMSHNSAGFRTHTLVCLGACLAMLTNLFLFQQYSKAAPVDVSHLGGYVLGGIGFLGAGAIIKDGVRVRGLTTAASIWVVATIGLAVGCGFYIAALAAGAFTMLTLWALKYLEEVAFSRKGTVSVEMQIRNEPGQLAGVLSSLVELGCAVKNVQLEQSDDEWIGLALTLKLPEGIDVKQTKARILTVPGVKM